MIKKIYIIAFMTVFFLKADAQKENTPPSPDAASLQKAFSTDVKLYEGKVDIKIPIYTVKNRSLTVNIDLTYTGSRGIKLQEIAGVAGIGWALGAGGAISVGGRGRSDNGQGDGYFAADAGAKWLQGAVGSTDFFKAFNFWEGKYENDDLSPDFFNSTIGGKIFFDRNKNLYFSKNEGYKIIQNGILSVDQTWVILDPKGNKYSFGKTSNDRQRAMYLSIPPNPPTFGGVSTWYLSEIQSPDGAVITFEYEKSAVIGKFPYYSFLYDITSGTPVDTDPSIDNSTAFEEVHLSKIITNESTVQFSYSNRIDFQGLKALSEIRILDQNQLQVKKYSFETGYFGSIEKRLKLNAVKEYNLNQDKSNLVASFVYNETTNLPTRGSTQFDHWGYHNANTTGTDLLSQGADKSANLEKCKANILTAIEWPTGGKTQFDYQLNSYKQNNQIYSGGGLRIANVSQVNNDGSTLTTNYSYNDEGGNTSGLINVLHDVTSGYIMTRSAYFNIFTYESNTSMLQATDNDGVSIGYSRVTVQTPDLGKEVYVFQDFNQFPDSLINLSYEHNMQHQATSGAVWSYTPGPYRQFNFFTSNAVNRGLLKEKQIKNSSGQLLQKINYYYNTVSGVRVPGSEVIEIGPYTSITGSEYVKYIASLFYEKQMTPRLVKTIEQNFDGPTQNPLVSNVARNEYGFSTYPSLVTKQISSTSSSTDSLITEFHYPFEFPNIVTPNAATVMATNNMLEPIEVISKVLKGAATLTTAVKIKFYKLTGANLIIPDKEFSLRTDQPLTNYIALSSNGTYDGRIKQDVSYEYDANQNLVSITKPSGEKNSLKWGYNNQYLVAEIKNASLNEFYHQNFEENTGGFDGDIVLDNTRSHTGKNSLKIVNPNTGEKVSHCTVMTPIALTAPKKFVFSGWVYSDAPSVQLFLFMMKPGETAYFSYVDSQQITTTGKWTFIQKETEVPADVTNLFIRLDNNNVGTVWFDDLRIQPSDASMTTYTYQPLIGKTSVTDNSGKTVYNDYDGFGRLSAIRDNIRNITKTYVYNYINNSNWQDNGVRQCVANSPTYEQLMQERDINPISLTYNQLRWKSLGTQDACIPTVYARLSLEQPSSGDNGEETWTGRKLIVRIYSDAACTIPASVPIAPYIKVTTSGSCGSGTFYESVSVNTHEFKYASITNYTLGTAPCYYSYSLEPGAHYIVVP